MWRIGLAFLLGHCCIHGLAHLPAPRPWGYVLVLALVMAAGLRSGLLAACLLGIGWAWLGAAIRIEDDLPTTLEGQSLLVRGYVASVPQQALGDSQFLFDVIEAPQGVPPRIRLSWYRPAARPRPAEEWQFVVSLKRRNGYANPGGFDFEGHLFREGIGASGYVRDDARNRLMRSDAYRYPITKLRAWIAARIEAAVEDRRMLGVLQGLAVGDTQAMSAQQWRVFAATGTTHLMAISGLHISMVAALSAWLGGGIARWRRAQALRWSAVHGQVLAGVAAAILYSLLAGMSVPTQRTLVMLCIYFSARWCRREMNVGHALGLALIGVLIVDPFAPLAVGAWLSFGAVAIILLAVSGRLARDGTIMSFARVQLAVTVGLVPLLLATFGSMSLVSPLANALAIPLFTLLVVPLVLLGTCAASLCIPLGASILWLPAKLLEWSWPLFERMAQPSWSLWYFPEPSPPAFIALVVGVGLLTLPGIWPTRLAGALLCLPVLLNRPATPASGDFDLAVLDVGQGLSVVVRTQTHVLVYDAGPAFQTGRDAGELVVLPYLRHRGERAIDTLMISHGDLDHRGGMRSIVLGMRPRRLLVGPSLHPTPRGSALCGLGKRWSWDGVKFELLHPAREIYERDNDSSCVLRIDGPSGSVLLTGDIEALAERQLVARGMARADVVIVPHHGSRTSSSEAFVNQLSPTFALISAGYRNRWAFPKADVVDRWRAAGSRTLVTSDSGAIEIEFRRGRAPHVSEYRHTHRKYWQR
jgi:competence protein ComEC